MNQAQQILADHLQDYTKQINEAIKKLGEGETISIPFTGVKATQTRQKAYWTPAKRRAQSERIKAMWAKKRAEQPY